MEKVKKSNYSCEDCEMAIIAGAVDDSPEAVEHLANCPACREFAKFQETLLTAEPVISGNIPSFARICSARRKQRQMRYNCLKFIVLPTAAAAALLLTAGGFFFHWQNTQTKPFNGAEYTIFADEASFAALLEESSVTLAWDQITPRESAARSLVQDVRRSANWNIEMFNPYNEDL